MKKIGFVDYFLSNWHADNYPAWLKKAGEKIGKEYEVSYAYAVEEVSPRDGVTTDEWCAKYGVERCNSIEELCKKSDYIVVLAPGNPEQHLSLAKAVLPFAKRTYIDKTFSPDLAVAKEIFALGEKYGTPFFSSSALRYADEVKGTQGKSIITTGGGRSIDEYIVHQAEMVVSVSGGADVESVTALKQGENQFVVSAKLSGGKEAIMVYAEPLGFTLTTEKESKSVNSDMFGALMSDIVQFFETGEVSFDTNQTLTVMKLREMTLKAVENL